MGQEESKVEQKYLIPFTNHSTLLSSLLQTDLCPLPQHTQAGHSPEKIPDVTRFTATSCHMFKKERRDRRKAVSSPLAFSACRVAILQREIFGERHNSFFRAALQRSLWCHWQ